MCCALCKEKLTRLRRLGSAEQWLLLQAAAWLAIARLLLAVLSFRRLSALLSVGGNSARLETDSELPRRISRAISLAANNVPWRADCFPQSIAARMLLRRHGYASALHIGVARIGDGALAAHAWLTCGETVVTGGALLERYTELHVLGD
jgi:hypothetical protein